MFNNLTNSLNQAQVTNEERLTNLTSIGQLGAMIMNLTISISFSVSIIAIGYAFIQFMMSQGDPKVIKTAQNALTWSIIAGLVSLASVGIKKAVLNAYGVTSSDINNGTPSF